MTICKSNLRILLIATAGLLVFFGLKIIGYSEKTISQSWQNITHTRLLSVRLSSDREAKQCLESSHFKNKCLEFIKQTEFEANIQFLIKNFKALTLHQQALLHVFESSNYNSALNLLANAIIQKPDSAELWNDLSAVSLLRYQSENSISALERALSANRTALNLQPSYEQALFNRAIIYEELKLRNIALEYWDKAILSSNETWLDITKELRKRLENEVDPIEIFESDKQMDEVTTFIKGESKIFKYLDNPPTFCKRMYDDTSHVVRPNKFEDTDNLLLGIIKWICEHNNEQTHQILYVLQNAMFDYQLGKFSSAKNKLISLRYKISTHSPFCEIAKSLFGSSLFALGDLEEAQEIFQTKSVWQCNGFYSEILHARNTRFLGSIFLRKLKLTDAIEHYKQSIDLLEGKSEHEALAKTYASLADTFIVANRPTVGWRWGEKALETIAFLPKSDMTANICGFLSKTAASLNAPNIQLAYANCFLQELSTSSASYLSALAHIYVIRAKTNLTLNAQKEIKQTQKIITDKNLGDDIQAFFDYAKGNYLSIHSPELAMQSIKRAQSVFIQQGNKEYELRTRITGIKLNSSQLSEDEVTSELENVALMASIVHSNTETLDINLSLERRFRDLHEIRINSYINSQKFDKALISLLHARGFAFDNMEQYVNSVFKAHNPKSASLLLSFIDQSIIAWLIDGKGIQKAFVANLDDHERLITEAGNSNGKSNLSRRIQALGALYNSIIKPIEELIGSYETLYIVPDDKLFSIPFPALWNSKEKRYLIETINVLISPEFAQSSQLDSTLSQGIDTAYVIDASGADNTRILTQASQEVLNIKNMLNSKFETTMRRGNAVTKSSFINAVKNASIVHFSGHGEINRDQPELSSLVFGNHPETALLAENFYELENLVSSKLVTLAACDTAAFSEEQPHALALVRPLLDKGTGFVIGSLKPISDRQYARMMNNFYQALVSEKDILKAYRTMQLEEVAERQRSNPLSWAAVNLYTYIR